MPGTDGEEFTDAEFDGAEFTGTELKGTELSDADGLDSSGVALICEGADGSATAAGSMNSASLDRSGWGSGAGLPLRREGGGGAAEGSPELREGGAGAGIPGPNGIVRGGGSGALILPTDGAEVDDRFAAAPSVGAD